MIRVMSTCVKRNARQKQGAINEMAICDKRKDGDKRYGFCDKLKKQKRVALMAAMAICDKRKELTG